MLNPEDIIKMQDKKDFDDYEAKLVELNQIKNQYFSYERLEFLGDAMLDMIVAEYLFEQNPHFTAGDLTVHKHSLVNNTFLSLLSLKYDFNKFLLIYDREKFIDQTLIL